jgi:hypothetical protein
MEEGTGGLFESKTQLFEDELGGSVLLMGDMENVYRFLATKLKGKRLDGKFWA